MNGNIYPFFLECIEKSTSSYLKACLGGLVFGKGGHIIKRKNKHILITVNGEFVIPCKYSESEHLKLEHLLWSEACFENLSAQIKGGRTTWPTVRKKDKVHLINKFVSSLTLPLQQKRNLSGLLILALFLKLFNINDIHYNGEEIVDISTKLITNDLQLHQLINIASDDTTSILSDK